MIETTKQYSQDKQRTVGTVFRGCLNVLICLFVTMGLSMLISTYVVQRFVELESPTIVGIERSMVLCAWLISVAFGAFVAAWGNLSWQRNSLWVGGIALLVVIGNLPTPSELPHADLLDNLSEMLRTPTANVRFLAFLILTLPAACLGGLIASRVNPIQGESAK